MMRNMTESKFQKNLAQFFESNFVCHKKCISPETFFLNWRTCMCVFVPKKISRGNHAVVQNLVSQTFISSWFETGLGRQASIGVRNGVGEGMNPFPLSRITCPGFLSWIAFPGLLLMHCFSWIACTGLLVLDYVSWIACHGVTVQRLGRQCFHTNLPVIKIVTKNQSQD